MRFILYSAAQSAFEPWSWTNPRERGIGGSESSHVEMAERLAASGHEVVSYAPVPFEGTRVHKGVPWTHSSQADFTLDGIWVVYRSPETVDLIPEGQVIWMVCQDVFYQTWTVERALRCSRIVALCQEHARYIKAMIPDAASRVCVSSNGIRSKEIYNAISVKDLNRNPKRMIYASSPDRGLTQLVPIFQRVREIVADAELHVFYGFDNIDKVCEHNPTWEGVHAQTRQLKALLDTPGVINHGRLGQDALMEEWLQSGIWCHPSAFTETSCITCMDAQATGAIPITSPTWAIGENVKHGVFIEGNPESDDLVRARYVLEVIRMMLDQQRQEEIRSEMQNWALNFFNWEKFVKQWAKWAAFDLRTKDGGVWQDQFGFQLEHASGRVLNVGCNTDGARLRELRGAINVDVHRVDKATGDVLPVDVVADARDLPYSNEFDTVVLGEILEHMETPDAIQSLSEAKKACKVGGCVVVTMPHDTRTVPNITGDKKYYAPGSFAYHHRYIGPEELMGWIQTAGGLKVEKWGRISYAWGEEGSAVVARKVA